MKRYILGAGAQGRVVADILRSRQMPVDGFLDDDPGLQGTCIAQLSVVGGTEILLGPMHVESAEVIVALGNAALRLDFSQRLQQLGHHLINAVHASAVIASGVELGNGICICAGAIINPDARIGDAVIINTGATVDHDCRIEDGAHLSPGVHLAGRVHVGRLSFLGTGVSVAPRVCIGAGSIIGAGAAVVSDIPPGVLAVGVPARVVRRLSGGIDWSRLL